MSQNTNSNMLMILIPVKSPSVPPKNEFQELLLCYFCISVTSILPKLAMISGKETLFDVDIFVTLFEANWTSTIAILEKAFVLQP